MKLQRGMQVVWWRREKGAGTLKVRSRVVRCTAHIATVCPDVENWESLPKSLYRTARRENLYPVESEIGKPF